MEVIVMASWILQNWNWKIVLEKLGLEMANVMMKWIFLSATTMEVIVAWNLTSKDFALFVFVMKIDWDFEEKQYTIHDYFD